MQKKGLTTSIIVLVVLIIAIRMGSMTITDIQEDEIPFELYSTESYVATYAQFIDEFNAYYITDESSVKQLNNYFVDGAQDQPLNTLDYAYFMSILLNLNSEPLTIQQFNQRRQYSDYGLLPLGQRASVLKLLDKGLLKPKEHSLDMDDYMSQTELTMYMNQGTQSQNDIDRVEEHQQQVKDYLASIEEYTQTGYMTMDSYIQGVTGLVMLVNDLEVTTSIYDVNKFVITLLHYPNYTPYIGGNEGLFWQLATGTPTKSFRQFNTYKTLNPDNLSELQFLIIELSDQLKNVPVQDTYSDNLIDMKHLMGTLDAMYHEREMNDMTNGLDFILNQMAGWAGDLISLEFDLDLASSYEEDDIEALIGTNQVSHFMFSDYAADLDAVNIYHLLKGENLLLSEAIIWYYDSGAYNREHEFLENMGGKEAFDNIICLALTPEQATDAAFESYELQKDAFIRFVQEVHRSFIGRKVNTEHLELLKHVFYNKIVDAS